MPLHQAVVAHPESDAHVVLHAVPEQMNGVHACVDIAGQVAVEPVQLAAKVAMPVLQLAARH